MTDGFLKIAYYIFVAAIAALGLLLLLSAMPNASVSVKIVQSGSMEPNIKTGSIVIIHSQSSYKVGDVITFFFNSHDETPTTHRVVKMGEDDGEARFTTKGDANENVDPGEIEEDAVMGKVLLSIPFVGYILDFAKKPIGFALIIGLPAAFIIFDEGTKIYTEVRRTVKEEKEKKEGELPKIDDHV
jgi:signal peptidase I